MNHRLAAILPTYLILFTVSLYASFLLRFEFDPGPTARALFWIALPFVLVIKCLTCLAFGEWKRTFRYATLRDMLQVVAGATAATSLLFLFDLIFLPGLQIPRSVILIDCLLTMLLTGLVRSGFRLGLEARRWMLGKSGRERTIIYGSDHAGLSLLRALEAGNPRYKVIAFVDDVERPRKSLLAGLPVLSAQLGWKQLARQLHAEHVLIPATTPGRRLRQIVADCAEASLKTHVMPAVHEILSGRYKLTVRDVTINDLLRREPAELDQQSIQQYVTGRRVMVTGAAGSIGSELCRQILALNPESLVLLDQSEFGMFTIGQELEALPERNSSLHYVIADVVDRLSLQRAMEEYQPELMFHAAAYKHVPMMEANPNEAIRNNVLGTKNVVDLADESGVQKLVMISSDKAVRPSSVMGATKLVGEKYLQAVAQRSATEMITVRFGNVLNSAGSVVPTFRRQIEAGGPLTVTHPDMERFFMTIPEAVQLVLQAGASGNSGDVLILEMGEPVKIFDLAKDMIHLSGLKYPEDIDIIFTGIRPGEKLYEELFYNTEEGAKKIRDKIYCAASHAPQLAEVRRDISRLEAAIPASKAEILKVLWDIVGNYLASDRNVAAKIRKAA